MPSWLILRTSAGSTAFSEYSPATPMLNVLANNLEVPKRIL
jgi:hypothetical protein